MPQTFIRTRKKGVLTLYDLGCRPGDPSFDNGAKIEAALAAGNIDGPILCPSGAWHFPNVCDLGEYGALRFIGSGPCEWFQSEGGYTAGVSANIGTRFMGTNIFKTQGFGTRFDGITFMNGYHHDPGSTRADYETKWGEGITDSCAVEVGYGVGGSPAPSGKQYFSHCEFYGFLRGIYLPAGNHSDNISGDWIRFGHCAHAVENREPQANGFFFSMFQNYGYSDSVFKFIDGGGSLKVNTLFLGNNSLLLELDNNSNSCTFDISNLKVDANAAGWRLVDSYGPLNLRVRGMIGLAAYTGTDPVVITDYPSEPAGYANQPDRHTVDVKLWYGGKYWDGREIPEP